MSLMAGGDLAVPVAGDRRGDEIGAMARAVAVFRNNAMVLRDTERSRAAERARAETEKSATLEAVADAFEREIIAIADTMGHAAAELESFARGMTTVIDESHRHTRAAATAAEGSSESATRVASAIEELSASITDIGAQVANASNIVEEATRCTDSAVANTAALVTTDAIHQQNFVARKIAETVDGAATRTGEVSATIAGVSDLVHRSGRGADQVLAAAAELSRQAAALTRGAGEFVDRVRAA
jgi:methyl-accepting chemotaxis protein